MIEMPVRSLEVPVVKGIGIALLGTCCCFTAFFVRARLCGNLFQDRKGSYIALLGTCCCLLLGS